MFDDFSSILDSPITLGEAVVPLAVSLAASVIAFLMYQLFYGSRHIGAGVHRTFLIGGPAVTMIFLAVQTSIALGLGLLGALSFVRFRTPVKDPAEIGFLLLLIASSIGAATGNYLLIAVLFAVVLVTLSIQRLIQGRFNVFSRGHLMISMEEEAFPGLEKKLDSFLASRLPGLNLETMSTNDGKVGLHYQYRKQSRFDWPSFHNELNQLTGEARVEIFIS